MAIMNPVLISNTRKTLPNLPYPSLLRNLKLSMLSLGFCGTYLNTGLGFDLKKVGGDEFGETRRLEACYIDEMVVDYFI